ncbi:MAG: shikimate kinase [Bacteroidales bacterium]|nr:shikimate kinase [Bacteroidales bacterium]
MFRRNIFLIGFMGAGKSSIGKKLARHMGFGFIDTDNLIEEKFNVNISNLIYKGKIDDFRTFEHEVLLWITQSNCNVVATGGGMPCFFDNMKIMNENGITVYMKYSATELYNRLNKVKRERPLLKGMSDTERLKFITDTLEERNFFYNQAHYTLFGKSLKMNNILSLLSNLKLFNYQE